LENFAAFAPSSGDSDGGSFRFEVWEIAQVRMPGGKRVTARRHDEEMMRKY
jgi:hypothetical protein